MSEFPDWQQFRPRPAEFGDGSLKCFEFKYRLRITVNESVMAYEIIIPPLGVFPDGDKECWDDSKWFRRGAELDLKSYVN